MPPLVSILIPAYNSERWIGDTIKSALAQTWPRREIIIVDDGSKDGTLSVARRFASKEVTVVTQENQGASTARNKAFSLCQGDFIQWLDADDLLAPDKIAKQMAVFDRCGSARTLLSSAWGRFIYRAGKVRYVPTALWADLAPVDWLVLKLGQNLFMQTAVWLVSRELSTAAGPWDPQLSYDDDGEYFTRVILASEGTRFVPESKVLYRVSGAGSLSCIGRSQRKQDSLFRSLRLHIEHLRRAEDSERVRVACVQYLQSYFVNFYPERQELVRELQAMAVALGGELQAPQLLWKYAWLRRPFGWSFAKRVQMTLPRLKWSLVSQWDHALHTLAKQDA